MLEKEIEKYLVDQCKKYGFLCEKFTSPQRRSVPDRIITAAGRIIFVELKAPTKKPTEAQARDHAIRNSAGANIFWTDSKGGVDVIISVLCGRTEIDLDETYKVIV